MSERSISEILRALRDSVAAAKGVAVDELPTGFDEPLLEGRYGLDSVLLMQVILEIETRLQFSFAEEDLRTRSFRSLQSLAEVVATRLDAQERAA